MQLKMLSKTNEYYYYFTRETNLLAHLSYIAIEVDKYPHTYVSIEIDTYIDA